MSAAARRQADPFGVVAINLSTSLAHGAGLHHIRRYLGHVSIRMTEHYAKVAVSEIEDILQHIWVARTRRS
jgi:site-specific recombinase XerD